MQLRPDQLTPSLQKDIRPVYMVSGDEPLQVMECVDAIRKTCREQDYLEREVFHIDKDFDWTRLQEEAATLSLFSSRRILDLRMPSARPGREGGQALKAYCDDPPPDTVLLLTAGKLDKGQKSSAWFKALDKAGVLVQCWPVPPAELPGWIRRRCAGCGIQPEDDVVEYLCQRVEGNLLAASQEIEKLLLLHGPGKLAMAHVLDAIGDSARYSVFDFVDSALQGDRTRVVRIVAGLKAEGTEPILANWALARELRVLVQAAQNPRNADFTLKQMGVWSSRIPLYRACLGRHPPGSIQRLVQRCARIDAVIKGVQPGVSWDELLGTGYALASGTGRRQ
jgi:DNA polymerase-3 subunit delta